MQPLSILIRWTASRLCGLMLLRLQNSPIQQLQIIRDIISAGNSKFSTAVSYASQQCWAHIYCVGMRYLDGSKITL